MGAHTGDVVEVDAVRIMKYKVLEIQKYIRHRETQIYKEEPRWHSRSSRNRI